jgi:cell division protein FtsB
VKDPLRNAHEMAAEARINLGKLADWARLWGGNFTLEATIKYLHAKSEALEAEINGLREAYWKRRKPAKETP